MKKNKETIKYLEKENSYFNKRLDEMDAVVDRQEQYSGRNCLLVHGIVVETVADTDKKIIKTLQQSTDETIKPEDIDRSHRLGKPKSSKNAKPCLIIIKFVRYKTPNKFIIVNLKLMIVIFFFSAMSQTNHREKKKFFLILLRSFLLVLVFLHLEV